MGVGPGGSLVEGWDLVQAEGSEGQRSQLEWSGLTRNAELLTKP